MPKLSPIFDANASLDLYALALEDAYLVTALYGEGLSPDENDPAVMVQKASRDKIEQDYRALYFKQFRTGEDLDLHLSHYTHTPLNTSLPMTVFEEVGSLRRSSLPIVETRPFGKVTSELKQLPVNWPFAPAEAVVTIEHRMNGANVALSHVPGSVGPTEFIREFAASIRAELEPYYKPRQIDFFLHVPREAGLTNEWFSHVEFEHRPFCPPRLKGGNIMNALESLDAIPKIVEQSFSDRVPDPIATYDTKSAASFRLFRLGVS